MIRRLIAAGALVMALPLAAPAQTFLTQGHNITSSGAGSVGYTSFEVTGGGTFRMYTSGPTIDPVLWLFEGLGTAGTQLGFDDDSCPDALCGPSGSFSNAVFTLSLGTGFYTLAVSDFPFDEAEARTGLNSNDRTGFVLLTIESINCEGEQCGDARLIGGDTPQDVVPEPATMTLLATGLAGLAAKRRRRAKR